MIGLSVISHGRAQSVKNQFQLWERCMLQLENVAIANALQPEAAPTLYASPFPLYDAICIEVAAPIAVSAALYTLLYAVTLTFNRWPGTFAVCRLWVCDVMKLYQLWTQSSNPRRSRLLAISIFDLPVMTFYMCYVLRSALGKFHQLILRQLFRAWIIAFFDVVTLWPWPFIRWRWKFVIHQASHGQSLYEIWAKSSNRGCCEAFVCMYVFASGMKSPYKQKKQTDRQTLQIDKLS